VWQPSVITLSWSPGDGADSHDVYFGTSFDDVDTGTGDTPQGNQDINNYSPDESLTLEQTYYWRIDEVIGETTLKGVVWNFTVAPGSAVNPSPADGASGVSPLAILSWTPGIEADTHELYFSTDFDEVNERSGPTAYPVTNSYNPGELELNTTYYWAVDEVNLFAEVTLWPGDVWQFTTTSHLVVDDMESYKGGTNDIFDTWLDGIALTPYNGSELWIEQTIVYGGEKSMKYNYDDLTKYSGAYGSRAEAAITNPDIQIGPDWTLGGAKALRLFFYGDPANSATSNDKMYIALNDGSTVKSSYYPDVNDIKEAEWQEWQIDLEEEFSGVNLASISKVSIGFGTYGGSSTRQGGTGTVYFDNIEVWAPYCRSEFFAADIDGDCWAGIADLEIMSADWLIQDYNFIASAPPEANLIGWWRFDEGFGEITEDSSAYDNDGNIVDASWTTGHPGDPFDSALEFDGDGVMELDRVICAERVGIDPGIYPEELMPSGAFTVAGWVKLNSFDDWAAIVCNVEDSYEDDCGFALHCYSGNLFGFLIVTKTTGEAEYIFTPEDEPYDTGTWYHVAGVYDGSNATIYVDAAVAAGPTYVGGPMQWISLDLGNYPTTFLIGKYEDINEDYYLNGVIDEVRYYDYALSEDELVILAELTTPGEEVYQPVPSPANIADPEPELSRKVNFVDYAVLADSWLTEQLWPIE